MLGLFFGFLRLQEVLSDPSLKKSIDLNGLWQQSEANSMGNGQNLNSTKQFPVGQILTLWKGAWTVFEKECAWSRQPEARHWEGKSQKSTWKTPHLHQGNTGKVVSNHGYYFGRNLKISFGRQNCHYFGIWHKGGPDVKLQLSWPHNIMPVS